MLLYSSDKDDDKGIAICWFEDGFMIFINCLHIQTGDKVKDKPKLKSRETQMQWFLQRVTGLCTVSAPCS